MDTTQQQTQMQNFFHKLYAKCWEDEGFKQSLITSPKETIRSFVDNDKFQLPENIEFVVSDQTNPNVAYINIPAQPSLDDLQLSDEQLEMVAGGEVAVSAFVGSMGVSLAIVGLAAGVYYATHSDDPC